MVAIHAAPPESTSISGGYLEVRTCDVYTGPCFANGEVGLTGKEGILVWSIQQGGWDGVPLHGLSVIAVIRTDDTLGNQAYQQQSGRAVVIVDDQADPLQREALVSFARASSGSLLSDLVAVTSAPVTVDMQSDRCGSSACASVVASNLVEISTRCLGEKDHLCGNEDVYYPPLTDVSEAHPAVTQLAAFRGAGLDLTFESVNMRSAFLASFAR